MPSLSIQENKSIKFNTNKNKGVLNFMMKDYFN